MLLSECERDWSNEATLIEDRTVYTRSNAAWGTLHSYGNINLASAGIVVIAFKARSDRARAKVRVSIAAEYVIGSGTLEVGGTEVYTEYYCICYVDSGAKAVLVESCSVDTTTGLPNVFVKDFILGTVDLNDVDAEILYSGTAIKTMNVATRSSFYGSISKVVLGINVMAYTTGPAQASMENIGEALTNGVQVLVDGNQVDWHYRNQDNQTPYGAAQGIAHVTVTAGANHTVQITRDNANTVLWVSIVASPWLLGGDISEAHCPITMSFPQGSTLYVIIQPMSGLQNIGVGFGMKLACTHDDDDFFSHTVDTGCQTLSYTIDAQTISTMKFTAYGVTGCISYIGVDIR